MAHYMKTPVGAASNLVYSGVPTAIPVAPCAAVDVELPTERDDWVLPTVPAPDKLLVTASSEREVVVEFAHAQSVGFAVAMIAFSLPFCAVWLGGSASAVVSAIEVIDPGLLSSSSGDTSAEAGDEAGGVLISVFAAVAATVAVVFFTIFGAVGVVILSAGVLAFISACWPARHVLTLRPNDLEFAIIGEGCRRRKAEANPITVCMQRGLVTSVAVLNMPSELAFRGTSVRNADEDKTCIFIGASDGTSCYIDLNAGPAQHWLLTLLQNWHVRGGV